MYNYINIYNYIYIYIISNIYPTIPMFILTDQFNQ